MRAVVARIPAGERIHILGGEPLLHPDILDLIAYSSDTGHYTSMVTNGLAVGEVGIENLLESGLSEIGVSLDGPDASVNDSIRGRGSFDAAWESLVGISKYLVRRRPDIKLLLSVTAMRSNAAHTPALVQRVADAGLYVDKVVVERVVSEGRAARRRDLEVSDGLWLDTCEQLCEQWREHRTLMYLTLRLPPRVYAYLSSRYGVFLRDSVAGCPGLQYPFGGCLNSDGSLYSCSRESLVREAQERGHLPLEGMGLAQLRDRGGDAFAIPGFTETLGPLLGPPPGAACQDCDLASACVFCPLRILLGEEDYRPSLCDEATARQSAWTASAGAEDGSFDGGPTDPEQTEAWTPELRKEVYVKYGRDGSVAFLSVELDRMVSFPEASAADVFDLVDGSKPLPQLREEWARRHPSLSQGLDAVILSLAREGFLVDMPSSRLPESRPARSVKSVMSERFPAPPLTNA